jgi:beta-glucosidase
MRITSSVAAGFLMMCVGAGAAVGAEGEAYRNASLGMEARVSDLLARMTVDEKISLVHADSKFTTAALPRFHVARRWMSDGPQGVREDIGPDTWAPAGHTNDFATAMPANLGLAASFDPTLATAYGNVIGEEASTRGKQVMLGPGVNILRTPLNGRNSEYLGEDPFLAGRMAVAYIDAVQSHGVASCVKHFAANNQETDRNTIDVEMDDRALHEIYLPAFKAAVTEAHVWCVMTAYNQFRGSFCSENELLLNTILKGDWQFQGLAMSDWSGTHSTVNAANHVLDLEMGTDKPYNDFYFADALRTAVEKHEVSEERLDDMARRNLRVMFATGMFDPQPNPPGITALPAEHRDAARRIEESAIVLLKNDHATLPLDASKIKRLLVVGELADSKTAHDGNSAAIKTSDEITPLQGIEKFVGPNVQVVYAPGYPFLSRRRNRNAPQPADANLLQNAVDAAKDADAVIVIAGLHRAQDQEGEDRKNMLLPQSQVDLLTAIAAVNPHTAVVLTGGAVEMDPWLAKTPALLEYWYGGTEGGDALANVLFGKVNPSAKLPCTFPEKLADSPAHAGNDRSHYPGESGKETYAEGIFVGYRWFDAKKIEPLFPFGYGLSYTTFSCSGLQVAAGEKGSATVQVTVANTGQRAGAEVVQVYVHDGHASLPRPERELKGFQKVELQPGEQRTVSIPLTSASFSYYDPKQHAWVAEAGDFGIDVGTSSRDLPLHGTYTLAQTITTKDSR